MKRENIWNGIRILVHSHLLYKKYHFMQHYQQLIHSDIEKRT